MAQLKAHQPIDMSMLPYMSVAYIFEGGVPTAQTATLFEVKYTDPTEGYTEVLTFKGTNFVYSNGLPVSGTVTSFDYTVAGQAVFSLSGITISVSTLSDYLLNDDLEGLFTTLYAGSDTITGSAQADQLRGFAGNDTMDGGAGADTLDGGTGNDTYLMDNAGDKAVESSATGGTDLVKSSVNHTLGTNVENLTLTGSGAVNATGNGAVNILTGNGSANVLDGKAGADTMNGGGGNDTYLVDNVADKVVESSATGGADLVKSAVTYTIGSNVENLTLTGSAGVNATGNGAVNILTGNGGANILDGKVGADTMNGGGGNDTYVVDNIADKAVESSATGGTDLVKSSVSYTIGSDVENLTLTGSAAVNGTGNGGANTLTGNGAVNILKGEAGNDLIDGGGAADKLYGGAGKDTLTGGAGADNFYFDTKLDAAANVDTIKDFVAADDTIVLDRTIFSGIAVDGTLASAAFQTGTAAKDGTDRVIYDQASGKIFYDSDGNGAVAAVLFAQVSANTVLTNADFSAIA